VFVWGYADCFRLCRLTELTGGFLCSSMLIMWSIVARFLDLAVNIITLVIKDIIKKDTKSKTKLRLSALSISLEFSMSTPDAESLYSMAETMMKLAKTISNKRFVLFIAPS
jgi:hypothetical protein